MNTQGLSYLIDALKIAGTSVYSFVALLCMIIAVIILIIYRSNQHNIFVVLGGLAMGLISIILLSFGVIGGFKEVKRVYYAGEIEIKNADGGNSKVFHVGIFRKMEDNKWEDVPLKNIDSYRYELEYERKIDGRFYLIDRSRSLRFEINTEEGKMYWQNLNIGSERNFIYQIIVSL